MKNQNTSTIESILLSEETGKIGILKDHIANVLRSVNDIIVAFGEIGIEGSLSIIDIQHLALEGAESVVKAKVEAELTKDKSLALGKFKLNKSSLASLVELPELSMLEATAAELKEKLDNFSVNFKRDNHLNSVSAFNFISLEDGEATIDEGKLNQFISTRLKIFARNKQQVDVYNAAKLIAETLNNVIIPACRDKYLIASYDHGYSIDYKKLLGNLIRCENDRRKPNTWEEAKPLVAINNSFIINV